MGNTNTYIKMTDGGNSCTITLDEAISELICIYESAEDGNHSEFTFSTVEMTQEEFDNLPEFTGF